MTADPGAQTSVESFSGRVLILFATSVVTTGIGIVNGFMLAHFLGPSGKGDFYLITLLPVTIMVLLQLGLPQALGFYTARGQTIGISAMTVGLTAGLCIPALAVTLALLPFLRATILDFLDPGNIILGLAVLPFALNATFTTGILLGRQAVRWYSLTNIGLTVVGFAVYVLMVGVLGLGLIGALWSALFVSIIGAVGYFVGSVRGEGNITQTARVSYRELFRFGLPLWPGTLTQFFALRVDVYLLALLLASPSAPLGYYSMAVTMAQLVFFLPNAVSTVFFPHVAGSTREVSDSQVATVSRITLITTAAAAVALIPVATILIHLILPAFDEALPAFYVLLPGVVALSLTKVLSSYFAGVGRTGWTSVINVGALVLNVVANLILIPQFGIVGAATASLISYSASAISFSILATRLADASIADFWIPRWGDVRFTASTMIGMGRRVLRRAVGQP
jgi:O-antigen/teichoic acid export membrane protein